MIGKFFSRMIKELTPADTSPVTFNATGNYNPRYGKQQMYVIGRGGTGSYTPGSAYYNYVEGTAKYTYVAGNANYNPTVPHPAASSTVTANTGNTGHGNNYLATTSGDNGPTGATYSTLISSDDHPGTTNTSGYKTENFQLVTYTFTKNVGPAGSTHVNAQSGVTVGYVYWAAYNGSVNYASSPYDLYQKSVYITYSPYTTTATYSYSYPAGGGSTIVTPQAGSTSYLFRLLYSTALPANFNYTVAASNSPITGNIPAYDNLPTSYGYWTCDTYIYSSTTTYNYAWTEAGTVSGSNSYTNYDGTNNPTYPYAGTYADVANTGTTLTAFGVNMPGGYGGAATDISLTQVPVPAYSTTAIPITVPSGGYITISFTL